MVRFNPGAISTVGNEWRAHIFGADRVEPVAALLRSTVSETIDSILMPYIPVGPSSSYGRMWCEVYDAGGLGLADTSATYSFLPNEDIAVSDMYYKPIGGAETGPINNLASNLDQYINDLAEGGNPPDSASVDYLGVNGYARFAFDTAALPAGRVLFVTFNVGYAQGVTGTTNGTFALDLYNGTGLVTRMTTGYAGPVNTLGWTPRFSASSATLYVNPLTGLPWTRADILAMDSGSNLMVQLTALTGRACVLYLYITVTMTTERRLAMGANTLVTSLVGGENTSNYCVLKTPAGADNWAKAASTNYLVVMRRLTDPANVLPPQTQYFSRIDSGKVNPDNQGHAYAVALDGYGQLRSAVGPETSAYGVIVARTDGNLSIDSQPYYRLKPTRLYGGLVSYQRISSHGSTAYKTFNAVIGRSAGVAPNANLTFRVKRVSDNVAMGGTATLTPAQLLEHPLLATFGAYQWYDVQIDLSSNATLVSGTQYYIEVVSDAAFDTPWWASALDETHAYTFGLDQSYGSTTDYALVEGVVQSQMDLALTLTVPPPAGPASITPTVVSYTLQDNGGAECDAGVHQATRVAWAATTEGVLFAHYEIQRSEDGGTTWATIKRVMTEATVTFDDVTAKRGVTLKYRVRTIRTTGLASAWRTQSTTTTLTVNTEAVIFATNDNPSLTAGYVWLNPRHRYEFPGDREVDVLQLHARDFSVVYRGTENRGTLFSFDLLIYVRDAETDCGGLPPSGKGDDAFDALRAIAETNSTLAVFTPFGRRIFGAVRVPAGDLDAESAFYATTVGIIETSSQDAISDL